MQWTEEKMLNTARQEQRDGYADFKITAATSALLVIDMQAEFLTPGPLWVPAATRMVDRLSRLIATCRDHKIPIIYTIFDKTHLGLDRPRTLKYMPHARPDDSSRQGEVWPELAPRADEVVIRKPSYGAFYDTPLDTILRNLRRDTVIITGTLTNYCCGMTARQAYERSYQAVVVSDLTATDDPLMQEAELSVLRRGFALVMNAEEIEAKLRL